MVRKFFPVWSRKRARASSRVRRRRGRCLRVETLDERILLSLLPAAGTVAAVALVQTRPTQFMDTTAGDTGTQESATAVNPNWSGYVAETDLSDPQTDSVTAVAGSWFVPTVSGPQGTSSYSSVWVGVNGYNGHTVEQVGTEQNVINGVPRYYAWWEMYSADGAGVPGQRYDAPIGSMMISPGDSISASVRYITSGAHAGQFLLSIVDNTHAIAGDSFSVYESSLQTQSPQSLRNSAEWIVEDPEVDGSWPQLANFGNVTFTNATATIDGLTGPINSGEWQSTPLNMGYSYAQAPAITEASTSALSNRAPSVCSFTVTYALSTIFYVNGGTLFTLQNGDLYSCPDAQSDWQAVDSGVTAFDYAYNGVGLYSGYYAYVVSYGHLDIYSCSTKTWSPDVANNVTSFAVGPGGSSYYFVGGGALDAYIYGQGWDYNIENLSAITDFDLAYNGVGLYTGYYAYVVSYGHLDIYSFSANTWSLNVANNVTSFAVGPNGSSYYFVDGGVLDAYIYGVGWDYNIENLSGITAFDLSNNGVGLYRGYYAYVVSYGHLDIYSFSTNTWSLDVANNVTSFAVGTNGSSYYFVDGGELDAYVYGVGWQYNIASNVSTFALVPDGSHFYILTTSGVLESYAYSSSEWSTVATGVQAFVMGPVDFSIDVLEADGALLQGTVSGWSVLAQSIQSIWLVDDGYTLDALTNAGTIMQFTA